MNDKGFTLMIVSPDRILLSEKNVSSLNIRLEDGRLLGIRPKHAPLIANTAACKLSYTIDSQVNEISVPAGIITVRNNLVKLLS